MYKRSIVINLLVFAFFSMTRICTKTSTFSDGSTIPKGTQVFLPFKALHHDPKYWEDPEKFNPDRLVTAPKKFHEGIILYMYTLDSQQRREPSDLLQFIYHLVLVLATTLG